MSFDAGPCIKHLLFWCLIDLSIYYHGMPTYTHKTVNYSMIRFGTFLMYSLMSRWTVMKINEIKCYILMGARRAQRTRNGCQPVCRSPTSSPKPPPRWVKSLPSPNRFRHLPWHAFSASVVPVSIILPTLAATPEPGMLIWASADAN